MYCGFPFANLGAVCYVAIKKHSRTASFCRDLIFATKLQAGKKYG